MKVHILIELTLAVIIAVLWAIITYFVVHQAELKTKCNNLGGVYLQGNCVRVESINMEDKYEG